MNNYRKVQSSTASYRETIDRIRSSKLKLGESGIIGSIVYDELTDEQIADLLVRSLSIIREYMDKE